MRLKNFGMALVAAMVMIGCSSTKNKRDINPVLDLMVNAKQIEFQAISAQPFVTNALSQVLTSGLLPPGSAVGRIDLNGTNNFLKIVGDSVLANLPYYGERRMGGGYNNNLGIAFKGVPKEMAIVKEEANRGYTIYFQIRNETELLDITIQLFSNLNAALNIVSTQRTTIDYTGRVHELQKEKLFWLKDQRVRIGDEKLKDKS